MQKFSIKSDFFYLKHTVNFGLCLYLMTKAINFSGILDVIN